jgi:hypothetical protein
MPAAVILVAMRRAKGRRRAGTAIVRVVSSYNTALLACAMTSVCAANRSGKGDDELES